MWTLIHFCKIHWTRWLADTYGSRTSMGWLELSRNFTQNIFIPGLLFKFEIFSICVSYKGTFCQESHFGPILASFLTLSDQPPRLFRTWENSNCNVSKINCSNCNTMFPNVFLKLSIRYSEELKRHIQKTPQEGFILKSLRDYYSDLRDLSGKDPTFEKAWKMAERYFNKKNNVIVDRPSSAKKFRQAGGGGRVKVKEVRLAMFDWFLDIQGCLKERLTKKMFSTKCEGIYG